MDQMNRLGRGGNIPGKSRSIPFNMGNAHLHEKFIRIGDGKLLNEADYTSSIQSPLQGYQYTDSLNHPGWKRGLRDLADHGGPFFSQRNYVDAKMAPRISFRGQRVTGSGAPSDQLILANYDGPCLPINLGRNAWPAFIDSDGDTLDEKGATCIANCLPTNSPANAAQFLGEILAAGGLPKLVGEVWKNTTKKAKAAGSEYLNAQYGWAPIASDIGSFMAAVYTADLIMNQFERDAGRVVRRGWNMPTEADESSTVFRENESPWTPISSGGMFGPLTGQGRVLRTRKTSTECWFSGAFTYYLPKGYNARSEMSRRALMARQVFGLELTPELVWELTPWSWAVDWFSNVGDVVHNISAFAKNGLVMRYGYVMEHSMIRDTYAFSGETGFTAPVTVPTITLVSETKQRRQANPFGFGVNWSGLNPFQLSIAAALGLSKSGK